MTQIIGHRGARKEAPENTVEGFVHAQLNGCKAFELDIQLSSDDELIVFHDTSLLRITGVRGKASNYSVSELSLLDARGPIIWPSPCAIPSLKEVLHNSPNVEDWQFEVKPSNRITLDKIVRLLARLYYEDRLVSGTMTITSSSKYLLSRVKTLYPDLRTGLVVEFVGRKAVNHCLKLGCTLLVINDSLCNASLVSEAHAHGIEVSVWTVNKLERMAELKQMGVDSIITDIPSSAIQTI